MNWYLAAPFLHDESDLWLAPFVPNDKADLHFKAVPASYHHDRSKQYTRPNEWLDYFRHAHQVWRAARGARERSGIVTCFPQLPIALGLRKRLTGADVPLVAWTFNLGTLYTGWKRHLARFALASVDRFIVHSRSEIDACSNWLQLPRERFIFVPLQRAIRPIEMEEDRAQPFILSMGSAHRDYALLFSVVAKLGYRTIVVAASHAVDNLTIPPNVEVRSGLTTAQCHELVQRARISVIPVSNLQTASGQVTLLDAMMFGRPVVMTDCPASKDYVVSGHDALLVRHGDHEELASALCKLWDDEGLRTRLAIEARHTAIARFSDEAIGRAMGLVLRDISTTA